MRLEGKRHDNKNENMMSHSVQGQSLLQPLAWSLHSETQTDHLRFTMAALLKRIQYIIRQPRVFRKAGVRNREVPWRTLFINYRYGFNFRIKYLE
jgi:hypothetical protein